MTTDKSKNFFRVSAEDFKKIPGSPIAYWVSDAFLDIYNRGQLLSLVCKPTQGLATGDNNRFLRLWFEVDVHETSFACTSVISLTPCGEKLKTKIKSY
jgi:hypothetical protein